MLDEATKKRTGCQELIYQAKKIVMKRCFRNKDKTNVFIDDQDYTSGEDETDFDVKFSDLNDQEKQMRLEFLWHRAYLRAHGGAIILKKFTEVHRNILIFGTTKHISSDPNQAERDAYKKRLPFIMLPDAKLRSMWNIIIMILLFYTATFLPIRTAFID